MTLNLKEAFEVENKHEAFFTGGNIRWSEDGDNLFCQSATHISIVSVSKGIVKTKIGQINNDADNDVINSFDINFDGSFIVTHHKSSLFKLWNTTDGKIKKVWKSIHNGPVAKIALAKYGSLMASGGIDNSVRLWDIEHNTCTYNLKNLQGVASIVEYHPNEDKKLIFASADDYFIHAWNFKTGTEEMCLEGHFSKVTSLSFHEDGIHLLSSGRDKVMILWNIEQKCQIRVVPLFENVEGSFIISNLCEIPFERKEGKIYAACAGEKGNVKIWDMKSGRKVYEQINSLVPPAIGEDVLAVTHVLFNQKTNSVALVSTNHNIFIYTLNEFTCTKQLVGYIDEILDVVYIGNYNTHIALATNTPEIKLYELSTMHSQILTGHKKIVLSLATTPANRNLMISSDKDCSICIWLFDEQTKKMVCIGSATKHTAAVGSIALSQLSCKFLVSVSQDLCLKLWDLPENLELSGNRINPPVVNTVVAHQKDVNSVTISPNDKLIATGSQDKTAKLWSADNLQLLGTLRGHRKGVWCVRFSPIDQVLATSSADCTLKLWSLSELNCIKTFEGHDCAVLRIEFVSRGMQIITSATDGLMKLWNVKTAECVTTLDQHEDRVWTFAVSKDEKNIISGDANSSLIIWRDVTEEKKAQAVAEQEQLVLEEQKLSNCIQANKLTKALKLALKLEKPLQVFRIVEAIIKKGDEKLTSTIYDLKPLQQEELLKCVITWNTNGRHCQLAQTVLNIIMSEIELENLPTSDLRSKLEALIPYTDRHYKRITQLEADLHLLSYTIHCMKSYNPPTTECTDL